MAKREIVTIECDGPCGGANPIKDDHDATWLISRSDRKVRALDLCDECGAVVQDLFDRGLPRRVGRPATTATRKRQQRAAIEGQKNNFPEPIAGDRPAGITVEDTDAPDTIHPSFFQVENVQDEPGEAPLGGLVDLDEVTRLRAVEERLDSIGGTPELVPAEPDDDLDSIAPPVVHYDWPAGTPTRNG